jgi:hypothetical protein
VACARGHRLDKLKDSLQDVANMGRLKTSGRRVAEFKALYSQLHWLFAGGACVLTQPYRRPAILLRSLGTRLS